MDSRENKKGPGIDRSIDQPTDQRVVDGSEEAFHSLELLAPGARDAAGGLEDGLRLALLLRGGCCV